MRPLRYLSWSYDARGDTFSYSGLSGASRFGHALQQKRVRLTKNRVCAVYCSGIASYRSVLLQERLQRLQIRSKEKDEYGK